MTSRSKAKGDRAERAAVAWYAEHLDPAATRTRAGYARDYGDLHVFGDQSAIAQVKDCQVLRWGEWLAELAEQKAAAGAGVAWLVVKRPGMGDPGTWLAVMTVAEHAELIGAADEVVKYWRDWPQQRRDAVAALSQFVAAAIDSLSYVMRRERRQS